MNGGCSQFLVMMATFNFINFRLSNKILDWITGITGLWSGSGFVVARSKTRFTLQLSVPSPTINLQMYLFGLPRPNSWVCTCHWSWNQNENKSATNVFRDKAFGLCLDLVNQSKKNLTNLFQRVRLKQEEHHVPLHFCFNYSRWQNWFLSLFWRRFFFPKV